MEKVKYLILGAGVSGLSFATTIDSDDYLIIEKESEAGGYCRTIRRGEFVWDYAGHFFHFSHPELKKNFEKITTSDNTVSRIKNTKIYYKGYYVDYPFQKNIHQLQKDEMIDCLYDLFTKEEKIKYSSFLDMLYGKFGKSITEKFLKPYNEKLYACNLNLLDVDAMGRFFPYVNAEDIIKNMKNADNSSYNQEFLYPKQGAAIFVEKLLDEIKDGGIRYNEEVISVDTKQRTVRTNKNDYHYEYLISSLPLNIFSKMLDESSKIKKDIFSYNQVLVFNLGFDKVSINKDIHWIYVPSEDINFYRAGYYNNIIGTDNLSMYIEIGYGKDDIIDEMEIKKQLQLTLDNLEKMGITNGHSLVDYCALVMNPAYVHITQESLKEVNKLQASLEDKNIYIVGRYGAWKYCSIEDCMVDSLSVNKKILDKSNR